MRRKIALLLAFTMVLTIIPMNVFASGDSGGASLAGQPTGALWERTLGRATNVRHWDPGVLVANPVNLNIFRTYNGGITPNDSGNWDGSDKLTTPIVPDASGNLRRILTSMEYFNTQPNQYVASIGMQIYNTQGFMGALYNDQKYQFENYGYNFENNSYYGNLSGLTDAQAWNYFLAYMLSEALGNINPASGTSVRSVPGQRTIDFAGTGYTSRNTTDGALSPSAINPGDLNTTFMKSFANINTNDQNFAHINENFEAFVEIAKSVHSGSDEIDTIDRIVKGIGRGTPLIGDAAQLATVSNELVELVKLAFDRGLISSDDADKFPNATAISTYITDNVTNMISGWDPNTGAFSVDSSPVDDGYGANVIDRAVKQIAWNADNLYANRVRLLGPYFGELVNSMDDMIRISDMYASVWLDDTSRGFTNLRSQLVNTFTQDGFSGSAPRVPIYMVQFDHNNTVGLMDSSNAGKEEFMVALLPRYTSTTQNNSTTIRNQVDMVLIRTGLNPRNTEAASSNTIARMGIPIEYITNDDTNDNPVRVVFTHNHQWPQAGDGNSTTFLTSVTDSRFLVTLNDGTSDDVETPRTFHRYGRALVPGIRIAEAVQSAFDQPDWWVEIELISNGFYWTEGSTRNRAGVDGTDFLDRISTKYQTSGQTAGTSANDIRPISILSTPVRTPETGSNNFTTLKFPITLGGVSSNLSRQVNDWLQINELGIGATDRARNGDVEAEVRLYRLGYNVNTPDGNAYTGHWTWHPFPLQQVTVGGTQYYAGQIGTTAFPAGPATRQYPQYTPTNNTNTATVQYLTRSGTLSATNTNPSTGGANAEIPIGGASTDIVGMFQWQQPPQSGNYGRNGDSVFDETLVVARYGEIGLELFVHEDDDLEDFQLRSGARDWEFVRTIPVGESRPIGTIVPEQSDWYEHQTVRAVLRETAPGSMPATGAFPTVYNFGEGIQVLGVKLWANEADFSAGHDDNDAEVWFGDNNLEADNFLNASIERNSVTIRPEIGEGANRRWRLAEIWAEFYISVQAGYEHLYGEDIEVTVTSGTVEAPFEQSLVVARAWDPITVETTNIVLDDNAIEAAVGIVRGVDISDITIKETRSGHFSRGQRVWLGFEGGISRGWGSGDHAALRATTVETTGGLQVSPIQHDSHGVYVEITHGSNIDEAEIIFKGVQVTGRVVPNEQYSIIVADSAVAHNWEGWAWINALQSDVGFTRGLVRGFFNEEPYITPAFRFEGADIFAPIEVPDSGVTPITPERPVTVTPPVSFAPQTLREGDASFNSIRVPGTRFDGPPLILVPNPTNASFQTSYVMLAVVADLLGVEGIWDPATSSGTFSDGVTTVVVTNNSSTATVNGAPRSITASGLPADARIINDRFYVPMAFFRDVVHEWPVYLQWNDAPVGQRSITVFPQAR